VTHFLTLLSDLFLAFVADHPEPSSEIVAKFDPFVADLWSER
jgi:hypothetical protein